MIDQVKYEWEIQKISQNEFDQTPPESDDALYMWSLSPKGHSGFVMSGMSYSKVKLLMTYFNAATPAELAGKTFESKHSDPSIALDLLLVEIKSGGNYETPNSKKIRQMAAEALANMELPDYSNVDGYSVYEAFSEVWNGFDPKEDWLKTFADEISRLSAGQVELKPHDYDLFRARVRGPAAYLALVKGDVIKRVILGPYETPISFDIDKS